MAKRITSLVPKANFQLAVKDVTAMIKATPTNTLHLFVAQVKELANMIYSLSKEEFIKRIQSQVDSKSIDTDVGKVTLVTKRNYVIDKEAITTFLDKNKIDRSECFSFSYKVVSKNQSVLADLIKKGIIVKIEKVDNKKVFELEKVYKEIGDMYIEEEPTVYLKNF